MRGDFSRDSFQPAAGFSRVLRQQGRLDLDADTNEGQAIQLRLLRMLGADLIGPYAAAGDGFSIANAPDVNWDFLIRPGRFYVDGWLCENPAEAAWRGDDDRQGQPWAEEPPQPEAGTYLAYLEVWERYLSAAEHDGLLARAVPGALREVALGDIDTAGRAQVVWQVRLAPFPDDAEVPAGPMTDAQWEDWRRQLSGVGMPRTAPATMKVKAAEPAAGEGDPCVVPARACYRGHENHLYRVEICRGGMAGTQQDNATFVWSRDNGSNVHVVENIDGASVRLAAAWRDAASAIGVGNHVEISSPAVRFGPGPGPIRRVVGYDPDTLTLTLDSPAGVEADRVADGVIVRRWDYLAPKLASAVPAIADDNALELIEGRWLPLEDGISIMFGEEEPAPAASRSSARLPKAIEASPKLSRRSPQVIDEVAELSSGRRARWPGVYRSGDYWLFEARVDLGDVIWPRQEGGERQPKSQEPHGVERHFAPLAAVTFSDTGVVTTTDLRRVIQPVYHD